jgi:hypothetical protein
MSQSNDTHETLKLSFKPKNLNLKQLLELQDIAIKHEVLLPVVFNIRDMFLLAKNNNMTDSQIIKGFLKDSSSREKKEYKPFLKAVLKTI